MRVEELSVGDWVKWNGKPRKIEQIGYEGEMFVKVGVCLYCSIEECSPIPLTPEILEKNGFKRKQYTIDIGQEIEYDGYRHILYQDGAQYDIVLVDSCGGYFDLEIESSYRNEDGDRILISSMLSLNYVEFVHQLQHALRLAGIDKEIKV